MRSSKVSNRIRSFGMLMLSVCLLTLAAPARGDDELQKELLGDLNADLLEDLEQPPAKSKDKEAAKAKSAGEDIGAAPEKENPLAAILERMRRVEKRIAATDASTQTQKMQQAVVDDLSVLIEELQKQCAKCKKSSSSKPQSQAGQSAARKPSDKPSSDSSDRLDKAKQKKAEKLDAEQLVKEVWGHLPPQVVEQMNRQSVDRFLPKYEQLIEEYFRRLAQDEQAN